MGYRIGRRGLSSSSRKKQTVGHRVYPNRLSRGQVIFLTIMLTSLISYIIVQMVKLFA